MKSEGTYLQEQPERYTKWTFEVVSYASRDQKVEFSIREFETSLDAIKAFNQASKLLTDFGGNLLSITKFHLEVIDGADYPVPTRIDWKIEDRLKFRHILYSPGELAIMFRTS